MRLSRSAHMSRIRDRDTGPEKFIRRTLWALGFRYRLRQRVAGCRPDMCISPSVKVAVFVDGCFWHGCPVHYTAPRTRSEFWAQKLQDNVDRDIRQTMQLKAHGFEVLRFWTHEVAESTDEVVAAIAAAASRRSGTRRPSWRVRRVEWLAEHKECLYLVSLNSRHRTRVGKRNSNSYRKVQ